jgi:protein-S-isoprenylcysteine O-methyltransferase Ste14
MVAGVVGLYYYDALFASHWALRVFQVAAFLFMVAARITFVRRGVDATEATSAAGGLVTTGPYAYLRHPIYAAIIHFVWAGATDHFSWPVLGWAETVTAGAFTRMHIEEHLLIRKYPEYRAYKKRVKKLVPFVY